MDDDTNSNPQQNTQTGNSDDTQPLSGSNSNMGDFSASQTSTTGQNSQSITEDEYNRLKTELEQTQNKLKEMMTISQHALADLQNFKRRAEEDRQNFVQYANAQIILDFLPALNNLERALQHQPKDEEWSKGVEQVFKQFNQILEKQNVKAIETVGEKFNPKLHEALMTGPGEKDIVIAEFEKGYLLGDRVLKPARVKVGNGEAETEDK